MARLALVTQMAFKHDDLNNTHHLPATEITLPRGQIANLSPCDFRAFRARLLVTAGDGHAEAGLQRLDQGIARLGPVVTLIGYAIEIETGLGQYGDALARFDLLPTLLAS